MFLAASISTLEAFYLKHFPQKSIVPLLTVG